MFFMKVQLLAMVFVGCCLVRGRVGAADDVFDSNGVKIRYVTEGNGEAVVLIHGWMSDSGMWGPLDSNPATKEYQLIALDLRGHGKSDKPHDAAKYDADVAADVIRLLDHLKIEKAHLVGYSSGSFVAGKVAASCPNRIRSIVFGGQAPILGKVKDSDFSEVELFARLVDEDKDLGEYILAVSPKELKLTDEQAKAIAKFAYAGKDVKAFAAAGRGYKTLAVTEEELKNCKAPMLFIHGGNESDHVKNKVAAARKALGRGELKVIDGGNHMTTLTNPEFGSSIKAFLRHGTLEQTVAEPSQAPEPAASGVSRGKSSPPLLDEAFVVLKEFESFVFQINHANLDNALPDGRSFTQAIAHRGTIVAQQSLIQFGITHTRKDPDRYSMAEIK